MQPTPKLRAVSTYGTCMEPYIKAGEFFLVEEGRQPEYRGQLVAVEMNGELKLHRWMGEKGTKADRMKYYDAELSPTKLIGTVKQRITKSGPQAFFRPLHALQFQLNQRNCQGNYLQKIYVMLLIVTGYLTKALERSGKSTERLK